MILYCDTSALVKLYVEESGSSWVRQWVDACQVVGIAAIGYVETKAAFARAVHGGRVVRRRYRGIVADFEQDWSRYLVLEMSEQVIRQAGRLAEAHRLRAYDEVHLAAALHIRTRTAAEVNFLGFDEELNRAAGAEGLAVVPPPS
ncbi:Ribonuclease VapC [Nitrospira tepida]|uniref:Ribonuclease VapC n=1 Tax=Nitrospira tepida TaxID=2973512 RepID=A0AA86T1I3_9BACT|nr:type II toxin-antitoxin system VapC family toxin [Nitrospira tepida]CAI4030050.1 Ribonuclease VapC [Nitrospira tepida]